MANNENIELRSEKVQNIIGRIPPKLVRYGTFYIIILLLVLILAAIYIELPNKTILQYLLRK